MGAAEGAKATLKKDAADTKAAAAKAAVAGDAGTWAAKANAEAKAAAETSAGEVEGAAEGKAEVKAETAAVAIKLDGSHASMKAGVAECLTLAESLAASQEKTKAKVSTAEAAVPAHSVSEAAEATSVAH